jgi:hypothetical protein
MKRWQLDKTQAFVSATGDLAYLGYDPYFTAPGVGGRILSFAAERSVLDARLETRWRDFDNTSNLPNNELRSGRRRRTPLRSCRHCWRDPRRQSRRQRKPSSTP